MNERRSFPLISQLPKLLDASDWSWQKPPQREGRFGMSPEWWIGRDREGRKWLVKMRNGFYAYREHVFASLAQRLGISCQSSAYLLIESEEAEPRLHTRCSEPWQLALCLMDEHATQPCSAACVMSDIFGKATDFAAIRHAQVSGIAHFEDLVRGDALGYLCGQFEPHGHFFTRDHEYVVIDNECMFAGTPGLNGCHWHECDAARQLIIEVCRGLVHTTDQELHELAAIPEGYTISNGRDLCDDLRGAKAAAVEYLDLFDDTIS